MPQQCQGARSKLKGPDMPRLMGCNQRSNGSQPEGSETKQTSQPAPSPLSFQQSSEAQCNNDRSPEWGLYAPGGSIVPQKTPSYTWRGQGNHAKKFQSVSVPYSPHIPLYWRDRCTGRVYVSNHSLWIRLPLLLCSYCYHDTKETVVLEHFNFVLS